MTEYPIARIPVEIKGYFNLQVQGQVYVQTIALKTKWNEVRRVITSVYGKILSGFDWQICRRTGHLFTEDIFMLRLGRRPAYPR